LIEGEFQGTHLLFPQTGPTLDLETIEGQVTESLHITDFKHSLIGYISFVLFLAFARDVFSKIGIANRKIHPQKSNPATDGANLGFAFSPGFSA
jgi:hypothetical protein